MADQTRNAKNVSLRMYEEEHQVLLEACEALSTPDVKVEPALLLTMAALEEAGRLGFTASTGGAGARHRPSTWENAPPQRRESFTRRITITVHPMQLQVVRGAAEWVGAEVPRFFIGSMLRFVANRQRLEPRNAKLRAIRVPEKYRP